MFDLARLRSPSPARLVIVVVLGVMGLYGVASTTASAQGFGFFGKFFGDPPRRPPPYPPAYAPPQDDDYVPRRRIRRHPVEQTSKETPRERPSPTKPAATSFVYVFGDSLGQLLANGLDDALSDRPEVAVVHKGRGSSGIVLQDYYDWPKTIEALLASPDKIDVAVMMIGSNDRQAIHEGGQIYDVGSDAWTAAYRKRVVAIDEAFRKKKVPLVWVGVPITKSGDFADDMAALNDIFREAAAKSGATYVDTWEAFSDDTGEFQAYGPDVNGQTVRLRTSDGIYLTKAGARKLAHFVEPPVRRDLDGKGAPSALPNASVAMPRGLPSAPAIVKPAIGEIRDLSAAPITANGELSKPGTVARVDAPAPIDKMLIDHERQVPPPGRADDLRWPTAAKPEP